MSECHTSAPFTKFGELPPELRIKIWQYAIPEARTIVVKSTVADHQSQTHKSLEEALFGTSQNHEPAWQSRTQIPSLLHVNAEARHEAQKHYKLSLGVGTSQPRIYIDFSRDTIFFGYSELQPECGHLWSSTHGLSLIRRLAVVPEGAYRALRCGQFDLRALQKLVFVHDTEDIRPQQLPHLVEDAPREFEERDLESDLAAQESVDDDGYVQKRSEEPLSKSIEGMKKRLTEAREEINTLRAVLSAEVRNGTVISTAVFRT